MHALASATVVHTVAEICADNCLSYCVCAMALNDEMKPDCDQKRWIRCSPDISFSINFTKSFVDRRVDNATLQYQKFVLHNNMIGQLVSS